MTSHIYTRIGFKTRRTRLLCDNPLWTIADEKSREYESGCKINGVPQTSIGAGHNATCVGCLRIYRERLQKKLDLIDNKLKGESL